MDQIDSSSFGKPICSSLMAKIAAVSPDSFVSPDKAINTGEEIFGEMNQLERAAFTFCRQTTLRRLEIAVRLDELTLSSNHRKSKDEAEALLEEDRVLRQESAEAEKIVNASIGRRLELRQDLRDAYFFLRRNFTITIHRETARSFS